MRVRADKADARPGDPIRVDVDVRDRAGQPARAEVTLYAVDEGVLSLTGQRRRRIRSPCSARRAP